MIRIEIDTVDTEREQDIMLAIDGVLKLLPEQYDIRWMGKSDKKRPLTYEERRVVLLDHTNISWSNIPYGRFTCTCGEQFPGSYDFATGLAHGHLAAMTNARKKLAEDLL